MSLLRRLLLAVVCVLPVAGKAQTSGYAVGFDTLYRVDLATGQTTAIGAIGFNDVEGLGFSPSGTLYGVADATQTGSSSGASDFLVRIDPATGAGTLVGQLSGLAGQGPGGNLDYGLAFTCDGRLWLSSDSTSQLWEVNPATAATQLVGSLGEPVSGLAASGNTLYGVGVLQRTRLFRIDPATAQATDIGPLNAPTVVDDAGLDFAADGTLWAALDPEPTQSGLSTFGRIDLSTGAFTATGTASVLIGMEGLAISGPIGCGGGNARVATVPAGSPAQLALLGLLCAALGALALRHRRA